MRTMRVCFVLSVGLALAGCGGGGGSSSVQSTNHAVLASVSGLTGSGLVLHDSIGGSAGEDLAISAAGTFTFPTRVPAGTTYDVTVKTQPTTPAQVCTVQGGSGTMAAADVTISVTCSSTSYAIGGTVSGLTGTGLVLHSNVGEDLPITANGSFRFVKRLATGATYLVTVKTQPTTPTQACTIQGGSGTIAAADVTTISVTCASATYSIGGTVSGLTGTGLVLHSNVGEDLPVTGNGSFRFVEKLAAGATYLVTVKTQPSSPTQACTIQGGSGTIAAADVTTISVSCATGTSNVVQRWEAPTTWGGVWKDDGKMLQHATFTTTNGSTTQLVEEKGVTWSLMAGPLGAPRKLDFPSGSRYGAGPFDGPHYQATAGDGGLAASGDMLVCAIVKPDHNPESGQEEPIIAKGAGAVVGGGWALVQRNSYFAFEYASLDSARTSHFDVAYTPTYFADQGKPGTGPLNPSFLVVCGGRSGESLYVAVNSFASSIWPTGVALTGTGPSTLDAGSHPATIGGYDSGGTGFSGRVYETAVWNEAATPASIQARFAAVEGLTLNASEPNVLTTYTRNREGPYLGSDGSYHTTWRHGPRIDPAKGFLFGLQGWNRLSYCVSATEARVDCSDPAAKSVAAPGEDLGLWTAAGGASVATTGTIEPPGDSEQHSAKLVTLTPSASLSIPLAPFGLTRGDEHAGPIHAQIWLYVPAGLTGRSILHLSTSNPVAGGTSGSDVDLTTLTPGKWTRFWLKGLTTDSLAGTLTLQAPASNTGSVGFYAWGIDLTQITGGGDLGSFDPGPAMYDWSTAVGLPGDNPIEQPIFNVDMLELPPVPNSTTSTGFCLSADASPLTGLSWVSPFVYGQGIATWVDDASLQVAQLISLGTFKGQVLCFYVTGAPGAACAAAPAAWAPGTLHNLKGCLNAGDHALRLYLDDLAAANEGGAPSVPDMSTGHIVVGNESDTLLHTWQGVGNPYPWNGYVSKVLVCKDQGSTVSQASCH